MSKELGEKLKRMRSRAGFTQQQIAERLNVDRSTYSNYERAVTEPDIKTLIMLAKVFGIDVNQLLSENVESVKVADSGGIPVYSLSKEEKEFVIRFRLINQEQKQKALEFLDGFLTSEE